MHALATPLITKADGTKFGKTEGGTVWLDPEMTIAVRVLPVLAERRRPRRRAATCKIFSFRSREEIEELEQATAERPARARGPAGAGRGADHAGARRRASAPQVDRRVRGAVRPGRRWRSWPSATLGAALAELPQRRGRRDWAVGRRPVRRERPGREQVGGPPRRRRRAAPT